MSFNNTGKNIALDAVGTACTHAAAYTDTAGTTEITGGTYTRKAITWASASAGSKALNGTLPVFNIPAGVTVNAIGFCTALTAGTQHAFNAVTAETFGSAGTYTVTAGTLALT